jgi:hypothetical protein
MKRTPPRRTFDTPSESILIEPIAPPDEEDDRLELAPPGARLTRAPDPSEDGRPGDDGPRARA